MRPVTEAFVAFGGIGLECLCRPRFRRWAQIAGAAALALVLLASALASRDMVRLWYDNPSEPTFPRSYIDISAMASKVPTGSIVLIDAPGADYNTLIKVGAVAYFLPDRTVRVYAGSYRLGTLPLQTSRPHPSQLHYVICAATPAHAFS